jgi:hypothetical protein
MRAPGFGQSNGGTQLHGNAFKPLNRLLEAFLPKVNLKIGATESLANLIVSGSVEKI